MPYPVAAREVGGSRLLSKFLRAIARFARFIFVVAANLGFRSAPPQALCDRRASRAKRTFRLEPTYVLAASRQAKAYRTLLNGHYVAGDGVDVHLPRRPSANFDFPCKVKRERVVVGSRGEDIQHQVASGNFGPSRQRER